MAEKKMIRVNRMLQLLFVLGVAILVETRNFHDIRVMKKLERIRDMLKDILATDYEQERVDDSSVTSQAYSRSFQPCMKLTSMADFDRVACKSTSEVRHLHNVKIQDGSLVVFLEDEAAVNNSRWEIPPISSWNYGKHNIFSPPVVRTLGPMNITNHCRQYFDGTLHVVGRSSALDVHQALSDNVLPLVAQIILDNYFDPTFLLAPRLLLTEYQPFTQGGGDPLVRVLGREIGPKSLKPSVISGHSKPERKTLESSSSASEVAIHLRLMADVMSHGTMSMTEASTGVCFRRIVWGKGPPVMYASMLMKLRRLVMQFARTFAQHMVAQYESTSGTALNPWNPSPRPLNVSSSLERNVSIAVDHPLKVIVYSRGQRNVPKQRSMENESLLVTALQQQGFHAFLCCDYSKMSLSQQLYYALHADVAIGLHGAALTHGVFMAPGAVMIELKTVHAYHSILYPLISASRQGIHVQIDVRDYWRRHSGGHLPMDDLLVTRVTNGLQAALEYRSHLPSDYCPEPSSNDSSGIIRPLPPPPLVFHRFREYTVVSPFRVLPITTVRHKKHKNPQSAHPIVPLHAFSIETPSVEDSLTWIRRPSSSSRASNDEESIGDFLFPVFSCAGPAPSIQESMYALGPVSYDHQQLCLSHPFQSWRLTLLTGHGNASAVSVLSIGRGLRSRSGNAPLSTSLLSHRSHTNPAANHRSGTLNNKNQAPSTTVSKRIRSVESITTIQLTALRHRPSSPSSHRSIGTVDDGGVHCRIRL